MPAPDNPPAPDPPVRPPPPAPPIPPAQPILPGPVPPIPRVRERDPPEFSGLPREDVMGWLERYQEVSEFNLWTPEQQLRHFGCI